MDNRISGIRFASGPSAKARQETKAMFDFDVVTGSVPWIRKPDEDGTPESGPKPSPLAAENRSAGQESAPEPGRPER